MSVQRVAALNAVNADVFDWRGWPRRRAALKAVQREDELKQMTTQELRVLYRAIQAKRKAVQEARKIVEMLMLLRAIRETRNAVRTLRRKLALAAHGPNTP